MNASYNLPPGVTMKDIDPPYIFEGCGAKVRDPVFVEKRDGEQLCLCHDCPEPEEETEEECD